MPVIAYDTEAKEFCRSLYVKQGGNADAVQRGMRERYPKWSKGYLYSRGQGKHFRRGWVEEYGFDKSLLLWLEVQQKAVVDDAGKRYLGIKQVLDKLQLKALGEGAGRDDYYLYRDFCNLEIKARQAAELGGDNVDSFAACWEKVLQWAIELDAEAATALVRLGPRLVERAGEFYAERDADSSGENARRDGNGASQNSAG